MPDVLVNPPTAEDVRMVLELLAARVPDRHVVPDDAMVLAWFEDLRRYDRALLQRAALTWSGLRFPAAIEFAQEVQTLAAGLAERERQTVPETVTCPECGEGNGMVEIVVWYDEGEDPPAHDHGTYRPCRLCRPLTYKRWLDGHMAPNHDCHECREIRRGKAKS